MARPSKLTMQMLDNLDQLLGMGCTIEVACDAVNINRRTFYNWKMESQRLCELGDANPTIPVLPEDVPMLRFLPVITQANARAHVVATMAVRTGLTEQRYSDVTTETFSETRLRKNEQGEEVPYLYQETTTRTVTRVVPPDWRAGVEFLKRRDPATWNPPTKVEVSFEEQAVKYIQAGEVDFWVMVEEYDDDYEFVAALFGRAGKTAPPRESAPANRRG